MMSTKAGSSGRLSPLPQRSLCCYAIIVALNVIVCVALLRRVPMSSLVLVENRLHNGMYDLPMNESMPGSMPGSMPQRLCSQIVVEMENSTSGPTNTAFNSNDVHQRCIDFLSHQLEEKLRLDASLQEGFTQIAKGRDPVQDWQNRANSLKWNFSFDEEDPLKPQRDLWSNTTFPDINIVGFPKAGTSQFYAILTSHADATRFERRKEYCMLSDNSVLLKASKFEYLKSKLHKWHSDMYRKRLAAAPLRTTESKVFTINGCLVDEDVLLRYQYLGRPTNAKFIFIFRDPADWLWAVWNFWIDAPVDALPPKTFDWAHEERHYRSPELFHEWIVSGNRTKSGLRLLHFRDRTVRVPMTYLQEIEPDRLLFLRNEDMLPERVDQPGGFLDTLAQFTGFDRNKFPNSTLHSKRNCNNVKGASKECKSSSPGSGTSYAITGYRPMLPETRKLIYLLFYQECKAWKKHFGIIYQDCLSALD